jgi:hypothetical protein
VAYLKNNQLQFCDVVGMDPVFSCLAYKVLLGTACRGISFDWVSLGSDKVVQL